jgi:beta-lactamase class A
MDRSHVEGISRRLGRRTTRRAALSVTMTGLAAGAIGRTAAQEATPEATPVATPEAAAADWTAIEELIREAEATGGTVGVAIRDARGELFSHNGDRRFHAASTIKIPILIDAYRKVELGALSLEDPYILQDDDRVPGSGVLSNLHAGLELTLADLLFLMISVSDNTATNLIIDRVGLDAVNATIASLGMTGSVLGRPMLGRLPTPGDPENWATPSDMALAIEAIVSGTAAGPESNATMLDTLEHQEVRRISRFLPDDDPDLAWGSKPGDLTGVVNDIGFITTDAGTLSIAVYCEDLPSLDDAERTIGLIAREALAVTEMLPFDADLPA